MRKVKRPTKRFEKNPDCFEAESRLFCDEKLWWGPRA
jgi:hypothetical protein